MPPKFMLEVDDVDDAASMSLTWSISETGTMHHKPSGVKISSDSGITFDGKEYTLRPEDIEVEECHLGAGASGVVTKGRIKTTGTPVAIKTIKVDDKAKRDQLLNEIRGLVSALGCPHLVQWYAGFVNKRTNAVHVALEFMDRGSLADLKRRVRGEGVPTEQLSCIASQVMQGLNHLHSRHFLHRDIKPENILHNQEGMVKLTDFGIAKDLDTTLAMAGTFVGTVTYMSPERALGQDYSLASDIWSVGMVMYELATGCYPFSDIASFPALFQNLCEKPEPRLDDSYNPRLADFTALCLTRDVAKRPDTPKLLSHPFVSEDVGSIEDLAAWLATLSD